MPAIKVECHFGYKANELDKIVDQWRDPQFNYFKVLADDEKAYLLRCDERKDEWELEKV